MSTLIRKKVLEDEGGLKAFGCYLAEDYFIAKYFLDNGWRVAVCSQPALQNSGTCDVHSFQERLLRYTSLNFKLILLFLLYKYLIIQCLFIFMFMLQMG